MVSVLLTLLKIIGIILLSLLGLFIVLLLLVLFVPVRYRFKGYYKDEFVCHGKVSWLLHFISFSLDYEKELTTSVKILGIPLSFFFKNKNTDITSSETTKDTPKAIENIREQSDNSQNKEETKSDTSDTVLSKPDGQITEGSKEELPAVPKSIFQKIKDFITGIKEKIQSLYHKICELIAKIKQIITDTKSKKEKVEHYISILQREEVKQAFSLCKTRIFKMLKHILPKKMKVNIRLGLEDPATTGYILAVYSILPPSVSKKIILHAYFNQQIMECDFNIKGYVNAWSILHQIICVVTDKNCKSLYQIVKKEISNERK